MRVSEWIQVVFALLLAIAAWIRELSRHPLPSRRLWIITLLAFVPATAVAFAQATAHVLSPRCVSILRDWLTAALFLVPYWQTGQFFLKPNLRIQEKLVAFDCRWLPRVSSSSGTARTPLGLSLEIAYLFCYPFVPLGLLTLYAVGLRQEVAYFWLVVLVSTYICYAITPFVPAFPPRAPSGDEGPDASRAQASRGRVFNRWVLQHGSIHAISFPSAHVASAFAVSLVLLRVTPLAGAAFLAAAVWIAAAAVAGRYHYMLDVVLGAATALAVFAASYKFF